MPVIEYFGKVPRLHPKSYVSPNAFVSGDVELGEGSSIFDYAVVRGDLSTIKVGRYSNIQDNCSVHAGLTPCSIGDYVTVGHGAVIHGATIGSYVIVGINSTVLDGAVIGDNCIIGAGAVVTPNTQIPPESMVLGNPAKPVKKLEDHHKLTIKLSAESYAELAQRYKQIFEQK